MPSITDYQIFYFEPDCERLSTCFPDSLYTQVPTKFCSCVVVLLSSILSCLFPVLNQFMEKLDSRYERSRKPGPGVSASARRERIEGHQSSSTPPAGLAAWMIDPTYRHEVVLTPNASIHLVPTSISDAGDNIISKPLLPYSI